MSHVSFAFSAVLIFEEKISLVNILSHLSHSLSPYRTALHCVEHDQNIPVGWEGSWCCEATIASFLSTITVLAAILPVQTSRPFPSNRKRTLNCHICSVLWMTTLRYFGGKTSLSVQTFLQLWWIPLIRKYFKIFLFLCRKTNPSFSSIKSWKQIKEGTETTKQIFYFCKNNGKIFWLNRADAFWRAYVVNVLRWASTFYPPSPQCYV